MRATSSLSGNERPISLDGAAYGEIQDGASAMSYALIRSAIGKKQIVRAIYQGLYCEMCPHAIGMRNGRQCALFYQFGGQSRSGSIEPGRSKDNWKCIDIDELSEVTIEDGPWHTAPYDSNLESCIECLHAVVPR